MLSATLSVEILLSASLAGWLAGGLTSNGSSAARQRGSVPVQRLDTEDHNVKLNLEMDATNNHFLPNFERNKITTSRLIANVSESFSPLASKSRANVNILGPFLIKPDQILSTSMQQHYLLSLR